ncbi:hypothetical protein TPAR_07901 [Tolypocladium paradoxum]|uniref:Uncharacterized protein n=1 Tax=Tolypocladium paradoxum TaxID=94208 RepID=A0A2S4KNZ8_9HYPO|nr:hypothetical protein TPAR_07901 [Tolypocladium paradoxum]
MVWIWVSQKEGILLEGGRPVRDELDDTDLKIYLSVSADDLTDIEKAREGTRFKRFLADRKLLIITIPIIVHERLHLNLYAELYKWAYTIIGAVMVLQDFENKVILMGMGIAGGGFIWRPNISAFKTSRLADARYRSGMLTDSRKSTKRYKVVKVVVLAKIEVAQGQIIVEKYTS